MEWARSLSDMEREVVGALIPMFPDVGKEVIKRSVLHPSNRGDPFNNHNLLNRCIDDLLELRTYKDMDIVDLTQDLQDSPQHYDTFSDGDVSLDLTTTIEDQSDNVSANDTRLLDSVSSASSVSDGEFSPQGRNQKNDTRLMDSVSSVSDEELRPQGRNQTNATHRDFHEGDQYRSSSTPISDIQPQSSNASPNDSSHDFNIQSSFEHEEVDSLEENHHQINTPSPINERGVSTPSPANQRQLSTPSPVNWQNFDSLSPKGKEEVNSRDDGIHITPPITNNEDSASSASDQRQLSTPSPIDWQQLGFPNPNTKLAFLHSSKDQRQLTTPSPMSLSSEELGKNPLSPVSAVSSNSTRGNLLSNGGDIPASSDTGTDRMKSNSITTDDSGIGSTTVSPATDSTKTPVSITSNSITSNSMPLAANSGAVKYKNSQIIDLTSPESDVFNAKSSSHKTLTDLIASPNTLLISSATHSRGALSHGGDQPTPKSFVPFKRYTPPLQTSLFPSSTASSKASEYTHLSNESVLNNKTRYNTGYLRMPLLGKNSAPSTATCACNDCKTNGAIGSKHSNTCTASQVRTLAPSTISRPPPSPPPSSSHQENAKLGISLTASTAVKNIAFPNSSISSNNLGNKGNVIVHTCTELSGKSVLVPGGQGYSVQKSSNSTYTSTSENTRVQNPNEGMLGVGASCTVETNGSNQDAKLSTILAENQRTLNNIQQEFNKLVNAESNRKMRNEVMGSIFDQKEKKTVTKHKQLDRNHTPWQPPQTGHQGQFVPRFGFGNQGNNVFQFGNGFPPPHGGFHQQRDNLQGFVPYGHQHRHKHHHENLLHASHGKPQQPQPGARQMPKLQPQPPPPGVPATASRPPAASAANRPAAQIANRPVTVAAPPANRPAALATQAANTPAAPAGQAIHRLAVPVPQAPNRPAAPAPQAPNRPIVPAPQAANRPAPQAANRPAPQVANRPAAPAVQAANRLAAPAPNRPAAPAPNRPAAPAPNRPAAPAPNRPAAPAPQAPNRPAAPAPQALNRTLDLTNEDQELIRALDEALERAGGDAFGGGGVAFGGGGDVGGVPEAVIRDITTDVLNLFGDADQDWVRNKVLEYINHGDVVSAVCNYMLENDFPKVKDKTAPPPPKKKQIQDTVNYFTEYDNASLYLDSNAERQGHRLLQNEFRRFSCYTIGAAMALFNHHYAPTKKCLEELVNNNQVVKTAYNSPKYSRPDERRVKVDITIKENGKEIKRQLKVEVNKSIRAKHFVASQFDPQLQKEIDFFNAQLKCDAEERDRQLALQFNEDQYEAEGQLIECGCCYGDVTFDDMIQCSDGHLFCQMCLQRYAQEATYGEGKAQIVCMTDGCESTFPRSQLQKALSANDLAKYDDRVGEESLQLADMGDNLVRCPYCNYAALMGEGDKVFQCQAADCKKETCRYCKEEWKDHFGIPCDEIEKKSDTKVRVSYEERMTMAKIRTCHRCKAGFTKSEGCNKMTCRCGAKMCYVCRKPNIDYNHFCRHPRDPGHNCKQCSDCSLWSNPEEDDERAIQEIRKQMEDEKKARDKKAAAASGDSGPPDAKKPRIE
ncbi:uncharacterized protein [Amphiura filiformis]|uniref:uncharacterized protein n=1 Tax=Amphiura filiformis TaxID=82378 RepID=UPI003B21C07B